MGSTEKDVFKVIALYRQYPCLWDYKSALYKRMDLKRNAWEEIAKEMKKSVEEVKKKIKYLRSVYVSEKKKAEESKHSGKGADDIYRPHLYYYNEFSFLDCVVALRPTSSNLSNESNHIIDVSPETFVFNDNITNSPEDSSSSISNEIMKTSTPKGDKSWVSLKRSRVERNAKFTDAFDAIIKKVKTTTEEQETMFSTFGKSIALQLAQLPLYDATNTMADMQKLLAVKIRNCSKTDIVESALFEADITFE